MSYPSHLIVTLLIGLLLVGCQENVEETTTNSATPPNIVWINTEDISPALGCYGDTFAITPNIDKMAASGLVYRNSFATAPICAPSRSCFITGVYATSLGTQHLRSEINLPPEIEAFPKTLQQAGFFTSNYGKTDFNFSPDGCWTYWEQDEAPWRQRKEGQSFFSMFVLGGTHEGAANNPGKYEAITQDLPDSLRHDPNEVQIPPYYPDTEAVRRLWARYYDLITNMDRQVGRIMQNLEDDGLLDNTIVFFFSDHGYGMPRYKRWLYSSGLAVPLVIHLPKQYEHLSPKPQGSEIQDFVSFVDYAPTVFELLGVPIPSYMQGRPFLGDSLPGRTNMVFGARSRADDMYEVSRCVRTEEFMYIRHYQPHREYLQPGYIFGDQKMMLKELRSLHNAGRLSGEPAEMWQQKPVEELYDLRKDPYELNNLAANTDYAQQKASLKKELDNWMLTTRDAGLFFEPEMMRRSEGSSPYEMVRSLSDQEYLHILEAANKVGKAGLAALMPLLSDDEPMVRFWGVQGLMQLEVLSSAALEKTNSLLNDNSPTVQIAAAELLLMHQNSPEAVEVLGKWVQDDSPTTALYAARTIQMVGKQAAPLQPIIEQVLTQNLAPEGSKRKYKDSNFAAFTSWALEVAQEQLESE